MNSTCQVAQAGTIILGIGENVDTNTFVATGKVILNEVDEMVTDTLSVSFDYGYKKFGTEGIFIAFLLVTALTMVGLWNISVAIILSILGLVLSVTMKMVFINYTWLLVWAVLGIIAIVRINKSKRT